MKALTIHAPWADMIARGIKTIETRGRPTYYRGELAIHEGKQGASPGDPPGRQAIVAVADLVHCRKLTALDAKAACCPCEGMYGYVLINNRRLARPVECRGYQGLWNVPGDVVGRVREELAAAGTTRADGGIFVNWCPVPERLLLVAPDFPAYFNLAVADNPEWLHSEAVHLRRYYHRVGGRVLLRRYHWHAPTRTLITDDRYEIRAVPLEDLKPQMKADAHTSCLSCLS